MLNRPYDAPPFLIRFVMYTMLAVIVGTCVVVIDPDLGPVPVLNVHAWCLVGCTILGEIVTLWDRRHTERIVRAEETIRALSEDR